MKSWRYRGWRLTAERDRIVFEREGIARGPVFAIDPNADLALRIKRARVEARLTQQQLAQRVGCSMKSVQNWEAGKSTPRAGSVKLVASVTDRSLRYFYGNDEEAA